MKQVKTSELEGGALDWAVAKCLEVEDGKLTIIRWENQIGRHIERETEAGRYEYEWWAPSRIWAQGGPIIEREEMGFAKYGAPLIGEWKAVIGATPRGAPYYGKSPLIAAMRCYVASKWGGNVEVPEELLT